MATREDVHRLLDEVPAARLDVIEQLLRASVAGSIMAPPRVFASTGMLSGDHDLAERSEAIVRSAVSGSAPSSE